MPGCAAVGCSNSSVKGFVLKCFPRNLTRRHEWTIRTRRANWIPTNNSYLCEVHFAPDMWEKVRVDGKRKLKHNAVPTIFSFIQNTEVILNEPLMSEEVVPQPDITNISNITQTIIEVPTENIPSDSSNGNITAPRVHMEQKELKQKLAKYELLFLKERHRSMKYKKALRHMKKKFSQLRLKYEQHSLLSKLYNPDQIEVLISKRKNKLAKFSRVSNSTITRDLCLKFSCGK